MIYFCHACGNSEQSDDTLVYYQNYGDIIPYTNPYHVKDVIHDNTMMRTNKFQCPNENCPSNKSGVNKSYILER